MDENKERRQHQRVPTAIPALLYISFPNDSQFTVSYECELKDISERGAMLSAKISEDHYQLLHNSACLCLIKTSQRSALPEELSGRALWIQHQGNDDDCKIGIFFEHCSAETIAKLRAYVDAQGAVA